MEQAHREILEDVIGSWSQSVCPLVAEMRVRYTDRPWLLDEVVQQGLLFEMGDPRRLMPTLKGLELSETPALQLIRQLVPSLKLHYRREPHRRWALSDLLKTLRSVNSTNQLNSLLLPLLREGVIASYKLQSNGIFDHLSLNENILRFDPIQPPQTPSDTEDGPTTLTAKYFRGLPSTDWTPEDVCLISGPNGSGKSTLLELLAFLRDLYLNDLGGAVTAHGGPTGLKHLGAPDAEPVSLGLRLGALSWDVQIAATAGGVGEYAGEIVRLGDEVIVRRGLHSQKWYLRGEQQSGEECCLRMAERHQWRDSSLSVLDPLISVLKNYRYYRSYNVEPLREAARAVSSDVQLALDGQNAYNVLRNWQSAPRRHNGRFDWVIENLHRAFPDAIEGIEFDAVGQAIAARFYPSGGKFSGKSLPMHLASDGMLVGLLHLTAVAGAPDGSIIAIDEMENQLHPHAIRSILASMREQAENRDLTVILTTHSPVLMNEFKDDPELFFVTEPGRETTPTPLTAIHSEEWLAHFMLGDLYDRLEFGAPPELASRMEG